MLKKVIKYLGGLLLGLLIISIYILPCIYFSDNKIALQIAVIWPYAIAAVGYLSYLGKGIIDYIIDK